MTVQFATDQVSVLLGLGDGTFGPGSTFAISGDGPAAVALADFDGDGLLDLATANVVSDDASLLRGNGDGSFGAETRFAAGDLPVALASDLDADADADLVVAARSADALIVLLGNGAGGFSPGARLPAGNGPLAVVALDVDGDGWIDLLSCDAMSASLTVEHGRGGGSFDGPLLLTAGMRPTTVAVADLDGNGTQDLAITDAGPDPSVPGSVVVRLGLGGAAFGPESSYEVGGRPTGIAVGDFDGDGIFDLVVAGSTTVTLSGNGDGTFAPAVPTSGTEVGDPVTVTVAVGDFDSNGVHDWTTDTFFRGVAIGDVTGDGKQDRVLGYGGAPAIEVQPGRGDGTFAAAVRVPLPEWPEAVAIGDLDRDGRRDLLAITYLGPAVARGLGNGAFEAAVLFGPARYRRWVGPASLAVSDIDVDGQLDAATIAPDRGALAIHFGRGDGTLAKPFQLPAGSSSRAPAFGDFDADGRPDLAIPNPDIGAVMILLNPGPVPGCLDADGDGYGFPPGPACPGGMQADCDDERAWIHPDALEVLNQSDEDCDLRVDENAAPSEVPNLQLSHSPDSQTLLSWGAAPGATLYELHRGSFSASARIGNPYTHAPILCPQTRFLWRDADPVPAGQGRYYLVRGVNANGKGYLGRASDGAPIPEVISCP